MSTDLLTRNDVMQIAETAVQIALAKRPAPSSVSLCQAAEILGISRQTAAKLNLRVGKNGKIPIEDVWAARTGYTAR